MSEPVVVLISGGMDSTVLLHHAAQTLRRAPIHTLSFDYGQRHARELDCAAYQSLAAGAAGHRVVNLRDVADLVSGGTSLVQGGADVPDLADVPEAQRDQPPTYVPNRNMMLLSIGAAYAEAAGAPEVMYGAQAHDEYGYWDCTPAFLEAVNAVLSLNRRTPVRIAAPLVEKSKADLLRMGLELGVDFSRTWSCYRGGEKACGTCPTCVERLNAWAEVGETDPLPYR